MNETYYELLVPKKRRPADVLCKVLLIAVIILLILLSPLFGVLLILLSVVLGTAAYFLIFPKLSIEYEYSLLNYDLDIDIIYGKTNRKNVIKLNLKEAEIIAPANSPRLESYRNLKQLDYSAHDASQTPYAIVWHNRETNCVLIQPDDVMAERFQTLLPRIYFQD